MADKFGATRLMLGVFWTMLGAGLLLSLPLTNNVWVFTSLLFVLGCGMGIGKAGTFKLIPEFFPRDVGAVGGLVGMLGAFCFLIPVVLTHDLTTVAFCLSAACFFSELVVATYPLASFVREMIF